MKKPFHLFAFSLALLLLTCSPPPFNLAISDFAQFARQLTFMGQAGPIDPMSSNQGSTDIIFIPEKDGTGSITTNAGFVYSMDPSTGQSVAFIAYDVGSGNYRRIANTQGLGPLSSDPYPNVLIQSVKSSHNGIAFQFDHSNPDNNSYSIGTGDPTANTFNSAGPFLLNTFSAAGPFFFLPGKVIGVSIYPDPNPGFDKSFWLMRDNGTDDYFEGEFDVSQSPITPPGIKLRAGGTYDISPFAGGFAKRVLYYYDPPPTDRSYVGVWDSPLSPGNWSTWVWIDNSPTFWQLTGIDHRIDALLTTGELFSTEGNVGRVYDPTTPTGSLKAEFPLHDLKYIGEVYVAGTPNVLFSQALWSGGRVSFNVYSLPTSELKKLGE